VNLPVLVYYVLVGAWFVWLTYWAFTNDAGHDS